MRRDLIKLSRAPALVVASVVMPVLFLVIFGNSLQGQLKHLPLVIVSQDQGPYGIRVLERIQALAAGPQTITISYRHDPGKALQEVRVGHYKAALVIPPDFSRDIIAGRIGELGLFVDNVDSISTAALKAVVG